MSVTALVVNLVAAAALIVAIIKNPARTKQAIKVALRSLAGMAPMVLIIVVLIGMLMGFVPREFIGKAVGGESGFLGVLISAVFGAVMFIPSLLAFPLAESLLESGAALSSVAAFITSLTMIGMVSLPMEIKELGGKMTLLRNGLGFVFALLIALAMGVIL